MVYKLKCKDCGYITDKFHGWAFCGDTCRIPNKPGMMHNWELLSVGSINKEGLQK